eukprot:13327992-Alexandrium_andersonii.AAC.1
MATPNTNKTIKENPKRTRFLRPRALPAVRTPKATRRRWTTRWRSTARATGRAPNHQAVRAMPSRT